MVKKKQDSSPNLISVLKTAILELKNSDKATPSEKLKAIELGIKLAAIELKASGNDDAKGFFD